MTKLLLLAGALVWGFWWSADRYQGPLIRESADYRVTEQGELQRTIEYNDAAQRTYRRAVKTPLTSGHWLGRMRRQRGTWQWWALGWAPLALAGVYAVRPR